MHDMELIKISQPDTESLCHHKCRMFGATYSPSLLARTLHNIYEIFPDEVFVDLCQRSEVRVSRLAAAEALSKVLVDSKMPEKLLKSIEAEVRI